MAISLNGYIAKEDGSEDFLSDKNWLTFSELAKKHDCFIIGRNTFELIQQWPEYNFNNIEASAKIVVSSNKEYILPKGYILANSVKDAVNKAEKMDKKSALLTGGSSLNTSFIKEGLINEVILNVEPTLIGKGIPVFAKYDFEQRLELLNTSKLSDDIVQLHYKINN